MPTYKTDEELKALQLEGLKWTVNHVWNGSDFYRERLQAAGVKPEDITSLDDIRRLPFVTAYDLRDQYPFPLRTVPFEKLVRIHASSGTTGKRKVMSYTAKDIADWRHMFARVYELAGLNELDRVQIAVGYGLWTAGVGFQAGVEEFGAMAIPIGPGNLDLQAEFLVDMETTVLCCTASMALLMAEQVEQRGIRDKVKIRKVILGSERHSEAMDQRIGELLGIDPKDIYDIPGMTELYGPGTGLDCRQHQGIHYWADYFILEILNPETLEPVAEGETGEMVVTTLRKEGAPLLRYRTRDLTRIIPGTCECGCVLPRHDKLLGRSDDMFIFRAVNIYPGQIEHVINNVPGVSSEYNIILDRRDGKDFMTILVEREPEADVAKDKEVGKQIEKRVKAEIMCSGDVEIVDYGSLPRSERKSKRVYDNRGQ
ncbi:MAG: phenylacetate--CoA ligase [Gaiellales bacterium]|nr:phenylacetate--CoA ligase [Gaiellales bacterium]